MYRLDDDGGLRWTKLVAKSKDFGASLWPLAAFDPVRGLIVVWGDSKKSGGRKDDTFVFDGKAWAKMKKGKEKPEGLDAKDGDSFSMFFEPSAGAIVRVSDTQVGVFDGKAWTQTPHRSPTLAKAWDQVVCSAPGKTDVLLVRRHTGEQQVVRLRRGPEGYTFTEVATFSSPHARAPSDVGGNATFDVGWFDAANLRVVAHLPEDASLNYALELGPLFER